MKRILLGIQMLLGVVCASAQQPSDFVETLVGTTNFGATNPGALCPNGMMSVIPFNVMGSEQHNRWDKDSRWWSAPYEFHNRFFTGFAHVGLSGVGCPELSSVLTMATTSLNTDYHQYGTLYRELNSKPGYCSLRLERGDILAEATATCRTSCERYTFHKGEGTILLNLEEGLTNEKGAWLRRVSDTEVEGMRLNGTFCYNSQAVFPLYFVMRVSKAPSRCGYWKLMPQMKGVEAEWTADSGKRKIYSRYSREIMGDDIGAFFSYDSLEEGEQIEVRIGVSFTSVENARRNLDEEQQKKGFDALHSEALKAWNDALGRIRVWGGTEEQKKVFYTALYHVLIHPNVLSDCSGDYPQMEGGKTSNSLHTQYTVFSLWDTYRNVHQLLTLVYPEKQIEMMRSMVQKYKEWGWLPKWELYSRETFTMEGDPSICVLVDSYLKGLKDFDTDAAYEAMKKSALGRTTKNLMRPDNDPYLDRGYIPLNYFKADASGDNSVSHALEYYVADYALSKFALEKGDHALAQELLERSKGYRHYYSPQSGTLRPLNADGTFLTPFNPRQGENFEEVPGFHEGSAWNYTFAVPHDVAGLAKLMGGEKKFTQKLQYVFDQGLYDAANEPDIIYPYLFSRIKGEEWRTQLLTQQLLEKHFTTKADGIPGNDDTGTMSAWAVFSMMGFYPDCPADPYYTLTTPVFDRIELDTAAGTITIESAGRKSGVNYIQSASLGSRRLRGMRIGHDELLEAKRLSINLKQNH